MLRNELARIARQKFTITTVSFTPRDGKLERLSNIPIHLRKFRVILFSRITERGSEQIM